MLKNPLPSVVELARPEGDAAVTTTPATGFFDAASVIVPWIVPVVAAETGPANEVATNSAVRTAPTNRRTAVCTRFCMTGLPSPCRLLTPSIRIPGDETKGKRAASSDARSLTARVRTGWGSSCRQPRLLGL